MLLYERYLKCKEERLDIIMNDIWTQKAMKRLLELSIQREETGEPSESEMASILSEEFGMPFTKNSVHGKLWREIRPSEPPKVVFMPNYERYASYMEDASSNKLHHVDLRGRKKILHVSDMHIPYHNKDVIFRAFNKHATADVLVMSELIDFASQSPFNDSDITLEREIEECLAFLEVVSGLFPLIIILESNHDKRISRRLSKSLPPELQIFLETDSLIDLLARPFRNIKVIPSWWLQVGDALFCHANKALSVSMKTAVELDYYFKDHWKDLGVQMPYRVLIQAHTHRMGVVYKPDLKLFESGMTCHLMPWSLEKPLKNPWSTGFITVEMVDGVSDLNNTREYFYEAENLTKGDYTFINGNIYWGEIVERSKQMETESSETRVTKTAYA